MHLFGRIDFDWGIGSHLNRSADLARDKPRFFRYEDCQNSL